MPDYVAFYNGKRLELQAENSYRAQCKAAEAFRVPEKKRHLIAVVHTVPDGVSPNILPGA